MSDIDILLFHKDYPEPTFVLNQSRARSKKVDPSMKVSLEMSVTLPLAQHGIIVCSLSSGPLKWQGIARIPSEGETKADRLHGISISEGRFKRLDIRY